MKRSTQKEILLKLIEEKGIITVSDVEQFGIDRKILTRLQRNGQIERIGRGVYLSPGFEFTERLDLASAATRIPHGIVCLLSALVFHQMTTQSPRYVWMAVKWTPTVREDEWPPLRFVRYSGEAFEDGIETHIVSPSEEILVKKIGEPLYKNVSGAEVKVYSPAKTIADCFKFRSKIGLDVAIEALRDGLLQKKVTLDELWKHAKVCRVHNVIRPYLEATV